MMTPKQQRFVEEYLVDLNAKRAALAAGYSTRNPKVIGCQLLQIPHVAEAVAAGKRDRADKLSLDATWVLLELVTNVREARAAEDYTASNRALELLGKHLALFPEKVQVDYREVAAMTDEELEQAARTLKLVS